MCFWEDQMSHIAREFGVHLADVLFMVEGVGSGRRTCPFLSTNIALVSTLLPPWQAHKLKCYLSRIPIALREKLGGHQLTHRRECKIMRLEV